MNFSVPLNQAGRQFDLLNEEMLKAAHRGLVLAGMRGLQKLLTEILPRRLPAPIDRGLFRAGWKIKANPDGSVEIYNDEPHAPFIEEGVRPTNVKAGRALLEALVSWALRKGMASDAEEALSLAWAIVGAMKQRGIFMDRGPYKNGLGILRELVDYYIEDLIVAEVTAAVNSI